MSVVTVVTCSVRRSLPQPAPEIWGTELVGPLRFGTHRIVKHVADRPAEFVAAWNRLSTVNRPNAVSFDWRSPWKAQPTCNHRISAPSSANPSTPIAFPIKFHQNTRRITLAIRRATSQPAFSHIFLPGRLASCTTRDRRALLQYPCHRDLSTSDSSAPPPIWVSSARRSPRGVVRAA